MNLGDQPLIKVNLKTSSSCHITAVKLCITAHNNVVSDVQPQSLEAHEEKQQWTVGAVHQETIILTCWVTFLP